MKKIFVLLLAVVIIVAFAACGNGAADNVKTEESEVVEVSTTEKETEPITEEISTTGKTSISITLEYGVTGDYGTVMTLENDGLVKEYIAYHVPAGTYSATNKGKFMAQISVYKDGTQTNENGIEEQIVADQKPLLIDPGATEKIVVGEGEYIEIYDNEIIELQLQAEKTTEKETEIEEIADLNYFKDMEIVTEDYSIKITDWKVIGVGEAGNEYGDAPVIAFWYDTTNTSGENIDPSSAWIYIMTAVQDNDPNAINELNMGSHPDSNYLDTQMATIKKGGTVTNAVAYELSDTETPVELTAKASLFEDAIGSMTFDLVSGKATNGASATIGNVSNPKNVEPSFIDNVIVTKDYTLEILDYKIIPAGEEGNEYGDAPVIAFWYNTTNTSGKDIDPSSAWIYIISAFQDNDPNMINELNISSLPDHRFLDSQMAKIKAGGTVENAVAYELTDTETPVALVAKEDIFGDDLGSQFFEIK